MKYQILPFRFARFNEEEYLLSNDVGEYIFMGHRTKRFFQWSGKMGERF